MQIKTPEVQQAMMLRLTYKFHPVSSLFHGECYELDFITQGVPQSICPPIVNTFPRLFTVPSFINQFTFAVSVIIVYTVHVTSSISMIILLVL